MSAATPTGAELRAWRERLGLSEAWIEHVLDGLDVGVGAYTGSGTNGRNRRTAVEGDLGGDDVYDADEMKEMRAAYAAALNAEEQRRAAAPSITWEQVDKAVVACEARGDVDVGSPIIAALGADWWASAPGYVRDKWAGPRIIDALRRWRDALREAAGEPAQVVGVDMASEPDSTVVTAAPLTEPVAPDGVTIWGNYVVLRSDAVARRVLMVGPAGELAEGVTPGMLRFAADLADYRVAQHAAGEQQRKLDAVRAAEEAVDKARRVEDAAATDRCIADNNWETAKRALTTALDALNAAKREAGL